MTRRFRRPMFDRSRGACLIFLHPGTTQLGIMCSARIR